MIPQRCYSDLIKLVKAIRAYKANHFETVTVLVEIGQELDRIIAEWDKSDMKELDDMAEEYEKSEKDCMWEERE